MSKSDPKKTAPKAPKATPKGVKVAPVKAPAKKATPKGKVTKVAPVVAKKASKKNGKAAADAAPRPASGKGSRQPVLELPVRMPDGTMSKGHPLLHLMERHTADGVSVKARVAETLGVRPQSLYKWERECRNNRNFPLPVLRAKQLADFFKVPPSVLRPDAFKGA